MRWHGMAWHSVDLTTYIASYGERRALARNIWNIKERKKQRKEVSQVS